LSWPEKININMTKRSRTTSLEEGAPKAKRQKVDHPSQEYIPNTMLEESLSGLISEGSSGLISEYPPDLLPELEVGSPVKKGHKIISKMQTQAQKNEQVIEEFDECCTNMKETVSYKYDVVSKAGLGEFIFFIRGLNDNEENTDETLTFKL